MCVLFIAWQSHPRFPVVLAANRDEFRARPTAPLGPWPGRPDVLGGRDLKEGGSWLAASHGGRFAAVTNFRQVPPAPARHSRGALVGDFVCGAASPADFSAHIAAAGAAYGGFNLFVGDGTSLWYVSNRGAGPRQLAPGLYGLSNGLLDDDWPKMRRGRAALAALLADDLIHEEALFDLLADRTPADDHELPDTGVGLHLERTLSSIFIAGDDYGTRSSTVLLIDAQGGVRMHERRWGANGVPAGEGRCGV
jgi:uncharacterized protein with NRDE domain